MPEKDRLAEPKAVSESIYQGTKPSSREGRLDNAKKEKRLYPLKPKERNPYVTYLIGVFDEWAAVAQHMDEVNKETENRERLLMRERQVMYRQELEDQRKEIATRVKMGNNMTTEGEKASMQKQLDFAKAVAEKDVLKAHEKKTRAVNIMGENIKAKRKVIDEAKAQEERENSVVVENLRKIEQEERVKVELEKQKKITLASALQVSYTVQEDLRKQQKDREKESDKVYHELHKEKLVHDDLERQKVRSRS